MRQIKHLDYIFLSLEPEMHARQLGALERFLDAVPGIASVLDRDLDNWVVPWIVRRQSCDDVNFFDHPRPFSGNGSRWLVCQPYVDRRPEGPLQLEKLLGACRPLQDYLRCKGISCRVLPPECSWHYPGRTEAILFELPHDAPKKAGDCTQCPWSEHLPGPRGGTRRCRAKRGVILF